MVCRHGNADIAPDDGRGREYNSYSIGRTMKKLGYESKTIRGVNKYLVAKVDYDQHDRENKEDAKEFVPEVF